MLGVERRFVACLLYVRICLIQPNCPWVPRRPDFVADASGLETLTDHFVIRAGDE